MAEASADTEWEATKARETARASQAMAIEAVRIATRANERVTSARYTSLVAVIFAITSIIIAIVF